MIAKLTTQF